MIVTNWGYTLTGIDKLPDMLTEEEYNGLTGYKHEADVRDPGNIKAACAAIRNYCGWHLAPPEPCELKMVMEDQRVTHVGRDLLIQLPAKFVSAVTSVTIGEVGCSEFSFESNGILKVYNAPLQGVKRYTPITITYTAGLPVEMMDGIKELVAHRVTHAAASSNGITSEAAGGVSVTYNAGWVNSARATALPNDNKEVLQPFRVQGVF